MTDEHGELEVRDWSGATYRDCEYLDKTVRLRRVRVSSNGSSVKVAEFMPGANGTKVMILRNCFAASVSSASAVALLTVRPHTGLFFLATLWLPASLPFLIF